jgi:WD40 repeat protein
MSFSHDGKTLATAADDGTPKLWNLSVHKLVELKEHPENFNSASFSSSNGQRILTASEDKTARLWRVENLDQLLARGCNWLKDYFVTHPEELKKLPVCQRK